VNKNISTPVAVVIIVVVVLLVGFMLYRAFTGGVQGNGKEGDIQAAPPVPGGGAPPTQTMPGMR
jgi:hypothetical protein